MATMSLTHIADKALTIIAEQGIDLETLVDELSCHEEGGRIDLSEEYAALETLDLRFKRITRRWPGLRPYVLQEEPSSQPLDYSDIPF